MQLDHVLHASLEDPLTWRIWFGVQRLSALIMLMVFSPLLAILCTAVRLESKGGSIYKQLRPGRFGQPFTAYKIRTMQAGADLNPMLARAVVSDAPEVTRIGRVLRDLKIDELPQLWNVVRGEMALVGPRPIAIPLYEYLAEIIPGFVQRLSVYPGLTSLGQVCIEENAAVEEVVEDWSIRFEGERHYLMNRSVIYDLVIIGLTIRFCLFKAIKQFAPRKKRQQLQHCNAQQSRS